VTIETLRQLHFKNGRERAAFLEDIKGKYIPLNLELDSQEKCNLPLGEESRREYRT
jgi:hypothetical protein